MKRQFGVFSVLEVAVLWRDCKSLPSEPTDAAELDLEPATWVATLRG
jgi:hypothetical protein